MNSAWRPPQNGSAYSEADRSGQRSAGNRYRASRHTPRWPGTGGRHSGSLFRRLSTSYKKESGNVEDDVFLSKLTQGDDWAVVNSFNVK